MRSDLMDMGAERMQTLNQGGEAGVNRHEDLDRKSLQHLESNCKPVSRYDRQNDYPFTWAGRRTDDRIELYLDCLPRPLSEFMEMVRSMAGNKRMDGNLADRNRLPFVDPDD